MKGKLANWLVLLLMRVGGIAAFLVPLWLLTYGLYAIGEKIGHSFDRDFFIILLCMSLWCVVFEHATQKFRAKILQIFPVRARGNEGGNRD